MRLAPLKQWICDECGEIIEQPDHGYLEWLVDDEHCAHGFRIVHHAPRSPRWRGAEYRGQGFDCYRYRGHAGRQDLDLPRFLGVAGLVDLLSFLDRDPYHVREHSRPDVRDMREFVEMFRRLQLPYYEEARLYWDRALADNFFDGANEIAIFREATLKRLVREYRNARDADSEP